MRVDNNYNLGAPNPIPFEVDNKSIKEKKKKRKLSTLHNPGFFLIRPVVGGEMRMGEGKKKSL